MSRYPTPKPIIDTLEVFEKTHANTIVVPTFAKHDLSFIFDFLNQYKGNKATFVSYRREIERLLQWSWLIAKKSVLKLDRHQIKAYIQFCLKPPISWIGTNRVSRFIKNNGARIANPRWRPFLATTNTRHKDTCDVLQFCIF